MDHPWWGVALTAVGGGLILFVVLAGLVEVVGNHQDEPIVGASCSIAVVLAILFVGLLVWVRDVAIWQAVLWGTLALVVVGPLLTRIADGSGRLDRR